MNLRHFHQSAILPAYFCYVCYDVMLYYVSMIVFQSCTAVYVVNSFMRVRIVAKGAYYLCRVRLSARISKTPTGRISMKFDIGGLRKFVEKIQILLKSGKNTLYFTCRPKYVLWLPVKLNRHKTGLFE